MVMHVVDEFQVLDNYTVMVLDQELGDEPRSCRIRGQVYTPISLRGTTVPLPRNYLAVKSRASFKGATVELG